MSTDRKKDATSLPKDHTSILSEINYSTPSNSIVSDVSSTDKSDSLSANTARSKKEEKISNDCEDFLSNTFFFKYRPVSPIDFNKENTVLDSHPHTPFLIQPLSPSEQHIYDTKAINFNHPRFPGGNSGFFQTKQFNKTRFVGKLKDNDIEKDDDNAKNHEKNGFKPVNDHKIFSKKSGDASGDGWTSSDNLKGNKQYVHRPSRRNSKVFGVEKKENEPLLAPLNNKEVKRKVFKWDVKVDEKIEGSFDKSGNFILDDKKKIFEEILWLILKDNGDETEGPFTNSEMRAMAGDGRLNGRIYQKMDGDEKTIYRKEDGDEIFGGNIKSNQLKKEDIKNDESLTLIANSNGKSDNSLKKSTNNFIEADLKKTSNGKNVQKLNFEKKNNESLYDKKENQNIHNSKNDIINETSNVTDKNSNTYQNQKEPTLKTQKKDSLILDEHLNKMKINTTNKKNVKDMSMLSKIIDDQLKKDLSERIKQEDSKNKTITTKVSNNNDDSWVEIKNNGNSKSIHKMGINKVTQQKIITKKEESINENKTKDNKIKNITNINASTKNLVNDKKDAKSITKDGKDNKETENFINTNIMVKNKIDSKNLIDSITTSKDLSKNKKELENITKSNIALKNLANEKTYSKNLTNVNTSTRNNQTKEKTYKKNIDIISKNFQHKEKHEIKDINVTKTIPIPQKEIKNFAKNNILNNDKKMEKEKIESCIKSIDFLQKRNVKVIIYDLVERIHGKDKENCVKTINKMTGFDESTAVDFLETIIKESKICICKDYDCEGFEIVKKIERKRK